MGGNWAAMTDYLDLSVIVPVIIHDQVTVSRDKQNHPATPARVRPEPSFLYLLFSDQSTCFISVSHFRIYISSGVNFTGSQVS